MRGTAAPAQPSEPANAGHPGVEAFMRVAPWLLIASLLLPRPVAAQCDLALVTAGPTDANRRGLPLVGEDYYLDCVFNVEGRARRPFAVLFELANQSYTLTGFERGPGTGFRAYWRTECPLDGSIPWRITLDPTNESGDVNPANNTASGTFEPRYPEAALEYYDPRLLTGNQRGVIRWKPGSGTIDRLYACFGVPTTGEGQRVLETTGPDGATIVRAAPHDRPVYQLARPDHDGGEWRVGREFRVEVRSVRANPRRLRAVTWDQYDRLPADVQPWARPERWSPSDAPQVKAFVARVLPADYQTTLAPYDAARLLHRAVMNFMDYQEARHPIWDALESLEAQRGNCGNMATLTATVVRAAGLPTRVKSGLGLYLSEAGHSWCEIWFPGCGWLPVDTTWARSKDPSGTWAYYFGQMPQLNTIAAVSVGIEHHTPEWDIPGLITPFFWTGTAQLADSYTRVTLRQGR